MAYLKSAKSLLPVAVAAVLTTLSATSLLSAPAPRDVGSCNPTKVKYVLSFRGNTTAANGALVKVADAAFAFTQARRGCVIVDFTAYVEVTDFTKDSVVVRAVLTPSSGPLVLGNPTDARFQPANNGFDVRTVQFMFADVRPGAYKIRMLMGGNSATVTDNVVVSSPNMVVHYN